MRRAALVLGATFLVIGIVVLHLWRELRVQREQNRQMVTRVAALEAAQPADASAPPAASTPAAVETAPTVAAAPTDPVQPARRNANPLMAGMQQTLNSPEGREFTRVMMRAMLAQQYPDLAKELNLSPAEAERFLDLLAKQRSDLGAERTSLQLGGTRDRAAREESARKLAEQEQAHEAELSAMLGSNYPKWKEYQRTAVVRQQADAARQQADQLRNAVGSSSSPLGEAQFQALNTALAAEQKRIDQDSRGLTMQQQLQRLTDDNRRLADVAAAHLTAEQLDRYRQYQEQQASTARAMMGAMGAIGVMDSAQGRQTGPE